MLKQLNLADLVSAVKQKVQDHTALECYDFVSDNHPGPYYLVEVISKTPVHNKTMFEDEIMVWLHIVPESEEMMSQVYEMVQGAEEALTEDIDLPEGYELLLQTNNGVERVEVKETMKKETIVSYVFKVCYGYKCKN